MQEPSQDPFAEQPVGPGLGQVKMPGAVHIARWAHRLTGRLGQVQEAPIFTGHDIRVTERPTAFRSQLGLEADVSRGIRETEVLNPGPEI